MSPSSLRCRALLFDLDGVLADSTASVEMHWRRWAEGHGMDAEALLRVVHGRRALDTIREVAPQLDAERELATLVAAEGGDTRGVVAAPGAAALLARLVDAGVRDWAVVTSGVRSVALARLAACGLPVPPLLVPADEIARGKPDPEGYLTAAARAAGMRCVGLATTHAAAQLADADLVAPSLAGLAVEIARGADGRPEFELMATR